MSIGIVDFLIASVFRIALAPCLRFGLPNFGTVLPRSVLDSIRRTAKSLTGYARRVFQAVVTNEHAEGKPRKAESLFGWNRDAVRRGLCEERIGREICSTSSSKGRPRVETLNKDLLPTAKNLLEEQSQADPKFQSTKIFTRMTGESFREALQ